jgi:ATP-dependent Clp protease ATP-binding subunit ClpC
MAEEGKLDPVVGREKEIERVCQILSRRKRTTLSLLNLELENQLLQRV